MENNILDTKISSFPFIKSVAKYFMDFLETDFHRRRNPKRSIKNRNADNLLVGLNLNKYDAFNSLILKYVSHNFDKSLIQKVQKGVYRTSIPKNLVDVIKLQLEKITNKEIKQIIQDISLEIEKASLLHEKNLEFAVNASLEKTSEILKKNFVLNFLENLKEPLNSLNLSGENNLYQMQEELTSVLLLLVTNKIIEIVKLQIAKEKVEAGSELKDVFSLQDIKQCITTFFEEFKVADLFLELYEMDRNRSILDKQEFYLYFCDIAFNNVKYPIFYIPFEVTKEQDIFNIEFDSQLYINKKALEYIVQEYNAITEKKGSLKSIGERIIYINKEKENLNKVIASILNEISNVFELNSSIDLSLTSKQKASSSLLHVSNDCYLSLFDKSDEALVNDYEEILKLIEAGNSALAEAFNKLIDDFINKDPEVINFEIGEEWDNLETSEKLVFNSPIPMNSEQLQILQALQRDGCKYIVVEGPPGTGKSHTITSIAFDSILKNKSVLVLSDKKEALDVVEDKITDTLNKVRFDKNFQNPLLRLGKAGSTYSQILSIGSVTDIITNYKAVKKEYQQIEDGVNKISNTLKEDISAEIHAYKEISLQEIQEFVLLKKYIDEKIEDIYFDELISNPDSIVEIEELRSICFDFVKNIEQKEKNILWEYVSFFINDKTELTLEDESFKNFGLILNSVIDAYKSISIDLNLLDEINPINDDIYIYLVGLIAKYEKLKFPVVGYLFTKGQVSDLDLDFKRKFPRSKISEFHKNIYDIKKILSFFELVNNLRSEIDEKYTEGFDYFDLIFKIIQAKNLNALSTETASVISDLDYVLKTVIKYPKSFNDCQNEKKTIKNYSKSSLIKLNDFEFERVIKYTYLYQKIIKSFKNIPEFDYDSQKKEIEKLVTTKMTYLLDGRLINFYEKNKATAKALRQIIKDKQQFPREEFNKLKEAFPCILASIRDYAEYIPLEPEIFDLVVIDEASQVSIAQAFPALLRAKKVLILGDKKQFSNVKSAQARSDTNREYTNNIKDIFLKSISKSGTRLVKLDKFNIKTSILDFFEYISNFNIQLLKHFRGYKEIISYSNKYFYKDSLQVMKIRGIPIDEVLKFSYIKHDGKSELVPNTNSLEIDFIISELIKLKESNSVSSVGIITPHTNQQKILAERISKLPEKDYLFNTNKLKIMTFDTCQGEERDIIFYSMVATEEDDKLWGIFIKDLASVDIEEDGKIKAQRLNVGFSRAKETMHFVLSKSIDKFNGSIGEALTHYLSVYNEAKKEKDSSSVDKNSKMEPEVLNWFYQTEFWKTHKNEVEFLPQFELGAYLKQLDKRYIHPKYKVDFLVVFNDEIAHKIHKIIIEYDGFMEHFKDDENVNEYNYQDFYSEADIYREKVLESYGYKFIRINKFNIGKEPIKKLNDRIFASIKNNYQKPNGVLSHIHETVEGLQSGEMKECPNCKKIQSIYSFRDLGLVSGYGRFCNDCKANKSRKNIVTEKVEQPNSMICPRCKSQMVLRTGRYGKFYGCSRYPYCKGTRQV